MLVRLKGRFITPKPPNNPGDYDGLSAAANHNAGYRFVGEVNILKKYQQDNLAQRLRRWAMNTLDAGKNQYGRRVLRGMLLGERTTVPSADLEVRVDRTAHLLVMAYMWALGGFGVVVGNHVFRSHQITSRTFMLAWSRSAWSGYSLE